MSHYTSRKFSIMSGGNQYYIVADVWPAIIDKGQRFGPSVELETVAINYEPEVKAEDIPTELYWELVDGILLQLDAEDCDNV